MGSYADELPIKQKLFCENYVADPELNAGRAYKAAGYKVKSMDSAYVSASRLLSDVKVQGYIQELMRKRSERLNIDSDYVLRRLQEVTERCMQAEPVKRFNKETGEWEETGEYKFDSNGANKSLELLGKHLQLFTEKHDVNQKGDVRVHFNIPRPSYKDGEGDQ